VGTALVTQRIGIVLLAVAVASAFAPSSHAAAGGFSKRLAAEDSPSDETKARARELYAQGVDLQNAGNIKEARNRYGKAFELVAHYQIAGNLGAAEFELGDYRAATAHLAFALEKLREAKQHESEQALAIADLYSEARAKVAEVHVTVDLDGVSVTPIEVLVDGLVVESVSDAVLLVDPGKHVFTAQASALKGGPLHLDATAGGSHTVKLALRPEAADAPQAEAASADASSGDPAWPIYVGYALAGSAGAAAVMTGALQAREGSTADDHANNVFKITGESAEVACSRPTSASVNNCTAWRDALSAQTDLTAAFGGALGATLMGLGLTVAYHVSYSQQAVTAADLFALPRVMVRVAPDGESGVFGVTGSF